MSESKTPEHIKRLPLEHCRFFVLFHDDELWLQVGMFTVNGYSSIIEIPFSDFSENFSRVSDFERLIIDRVYGKSARREVEDIH